MVSNEKFPDEVNPRIVLNSLLFPIGKAWHEDNPPWFDAVRSYEEAVSKLPEMLATDPDSIVDTCINFTNGSSMLFKCRIINGELFGPNTEEACSTFEKNQRTPGLALANGETYSLTLIGDIEYSYLIIETDELKVQQGEQYADAFLRFKKSIAEKQYTSGVITKGYRTQIPLMLGTKWCAMNHLDYNTLMRAGEDFINLSGNFIISGILRYLQPNMTKPLNKELVQRNDYDNQVSRVEVQYSRGCGYEHSYYIVASCLRRKDKKTSTGKTIAVNDYGFSLQMNHATMNTFAGTVTGSNKTLINFVPIKVMFAAFGCLTDGDMLDYICPGRDDSEGLVTSISNAVLYGFKHAEIYEKAHIQLDNTPYNFLKLKEPWTQDLALYMIGSAILRPQVLSALAERCAGDEVNYRKTVADTTRGVLNETFMPAIGNRNGVDRNVAVCLTMGSIVRDLYLVGANLKAQKFKNSLENKRIRWGQQITKEFKAFHVSRLNHDLIQAVASLETSVRNSSFDNILRDRLKIIGLNMGDNMANGLVSSFKGSGGENSKIRNSTVEAKNAIFIWNKIREVLKTPSLRQHDVNEKWVNRRPHSSEIFFLDSIQGPDSSSIGKYRTMCIYTRSTVVSPEDGVIKYLDSVPTFQHKISSDVIRDYYVVSINGSLVGYIPHHNPVEDVYADMMLKRRTGELIPTESSVILNNVNSRLDIWLDEGRILAPFVIVKNAFDGANPKKEFVAFLRECMEKIGNFQNGIRKGFIEYLDCDMIIQNCVVADCIRSYYENPGKYTHVSIGSAIDGIVVAANPCGTLNLPNRAQIATNHLKQAAGYPICKNPQLMYINNMDILIGAHQPLVQSHAYRQMHLNEVPCGQHVIVAYMQYAYNQEDAIVVNRRSVENGLMEIDTYDTIISQKTKSDERFAIPPLDGTTPLRGDIASYNKLGSVSCLPKEISSTFNEGDVLISKVRQTPNGVIDISETNKMPSATATANPRPRRCIEKHYIHERDASKKVLTTGEYRVLIPGDKCNFLHCQKETVGRIVDPESLPYTADGIVPDLIFNPVSIFKRKTYGMNYESAMGLLASYYGCFIETSTYGTSRTPDEISEQLAKCGLDPDGFVTMYDPETGMPTKAYLGVCYYQRQHHMVETKLNIRCGGPRDPATNQPTKGKRKHGGTKFDRMSCDALTSSGASSISIDYHLNGCNKIEVGICQRCHGVECFKDLGTKQWKCPTCGYHSDILITYTPMASVQLFQLLTGLHFKVKVNEE